MDECACWFVHELQAIPDSEDNIEKLAYMVSKGDLGYRIYFNFKSTMWHDTKGEKGSIGLTGLTGSTGL